MLFQRRSNGLIQNAKAVVQPTLYEGGPGGFSSYEAISYGKKLIVSDIPINREIKSKNTFFYQTHKIIWLNYFLKYQNKKIIRFIIIKKFRK